jgi:hypothetical protein
VCVDGRSVVSHSPHGALLPYMGGVCRRLSSYRHLLSMSRCCLGMHPSAGYRLGHPYAPMGRPIGQHLSGGLLHMRGLASEAKDAWPWDVVDAVTTFSAWRRSAMVDRIFGYLAMVESVTQRTARGGNRGRFRYAAGPPLQRLLPSIVLCRTGLPALSVRTIWPHWSQTNSS